MILALYRGIFQVSMNLIDLTFQMKNVFKGRTGFFKNGLFLEDKTFLRKITDVGIFCANKIAIAGFNEFANKSEERGFTGAIGTN
jgi:hypothetical protein